MKSLAPLVMKQEIMQETTQAKIPQQKLLQHQTPTMEPIPKAPTDYLLMQQAEREL